MRDDFIFMGMILLAFILFSGSPDIVDAIVANLMTENCKND